VEATNIGGSLADGEEEKKKNPKSTKENITEK